MLTILLDLAALHALSLRWVNKLDKLSNNLSLILLVLNAGDVVLDLGLVSSGDSLLTIVVAALCALGLRWVAIQTGQTIW